MYFDLRGLPDGEIKRALERTRKKTLGSSTVKMAGRPTVMVGGPTVMAARPAVMLGGPPVKMKSRKGTPDDGERALKKMKKEY